MIDTLSVTDSQKARIQPKVDTRVELFIKLKVEQGGQIRVGGNRGEGDKNRAKGFVVRGREPPPEYGW